MLTFFVFRKLDKFPFLSLTFLKKTNNKKGTYLQIYESFYDPQRRGGAHRSYKPIGYVHELQQKGIDDPIAFYSDEVKKLNQELKIRKQQEK